MLRLFDTADRSLRPLDVEGGAPVGLYVCGITPYDGGHLGHAFTYHTFDLLTRRLRSLGHPVRSVRNVTDVDDDMMRVSAARGIPWQELAEQVVGDFDRDMAAIDILPVDAAPRASRHVPAMIDWISRMVEAGFAYERDGWVYFEVARFPAYGELSGLTREAMVRLSRERGADPADPRKRAPLDFVLWQPSLAGEPSWASPWGTGAPAGTSSARCSPPRVSAPPSTFTGAARISSSPTTNRRSPRRPAPGSPLTSASGCTWGWSGIGARR